MRDEDLIRLRRLGRYRGLPLLVVGWGLIGALAFNLSHC
jgi:hypothetical protein